MSETIRELIIRRVAERKGIKPEEVNEDMELGFPEIALIATSVTLQTGRKLEIYCPNTVGKVIDSCEAL